MKILALLVSSTVLLSTSMGVVSAADFGEQTRLNSIISDTDELPRKDHPILPGKTTLSSLLRTDSSLNRSRSAYVEQKHTPLFSGGNESLTTDLPENEIFSENCMDNLEKAFENSSICNECLKKIKSVQGLE